MERVRTRTEDDGTLRLLLASRQRLELTRTPDPVRRAALLGVRVREVPTVGLVLDGPLADPEAVRGDVPFPRPVEDALLAATAAYERVALVTRDRRLAERAAEVGVEVWTWEALRARIVGA